MNYDEINARESALVAARDAALETYNTESMKLREELAAHLKDVRGRCGMNPAEMGRLVGVPTPRATLYQAEDGILNEDGSVRRYSVEKMVEFAKAYERVAGVLPMLAEIKMKPRPKK